MIPWVIDMQSTGILPVVAAASPDETLFFDERRGCVEEVGLAEFDSDKTPPAVGKGSDGGTSSSARKGGDG